MLGAEAGQRIAVSGINDLCVQNLTELYRTTQNYTELYLCLYNQIFTFFHYVFKFFNTLKL